MHITKSIYRVFDIAFARLWCGEHCGINPSETKIGDLAIKINHNGFGMHVQVWIKI
jgi:hypothetical protein